MVMDYWGDVEDAEERQQLPRVAPKQGQHPRRIILVCPSSRGRTLTKRSSKVSKAALGCAPGVHLEVYNRVAKLSDPEGGSC
jgi:hypothetical protein